MDTTISTLLTDIFTSKPSRAVTREQEESLEVKQEILSKIRTEISNTLACLEDLQSEIENDCNDYDIGDFGIEEMQSQLSQLEEIHNSITLLR